MVVRTALETLRPSEPYPFVRVDGDPFQRGKAYGSAASGRVSHTLQAYSELFRAYADLAWREVTQYARAYRDPIGDVATDLIAEMKGIAEGAGVDFLDILAVNVRTEVMYGLGELRPAPSECTAFAATPEATTSHHTLLGQNWDWHPAAFDSCVILSIRQDDGPNIVTVVEAGLLSKMGMNSQGLGVVTNAMVSDGDAGEPGVPYHVLLRLIQNCASTADAVAVVKNVHRASSANYLVADSSGTAVDLEVAPGGADTVFRDEPADGVLGHANCFVAPNVTVTDMNPIRRPLAMTRQRTISRMLDERKGQISLESMQSVLQDHEQHPNALCRHPLENFAPVDRSATVASVVMDLDERKFAVADGQPCTHAYREFTPAELWGP